MKTVIFRALLALMAALALLAPAAPARAELKLCNRTSYVLYAAVGIQQAAQISTRGWTRIVPGDCQTAISEPLKAPAYFVYARSPAILSAPQQISDGQFRFCVKDEDFSLVTPLKAPACKGSSAVPFASVTANGARSWTMTFTESPQLQSLNDARDGAERRYLAALGYQVGTNAKTLSEAAAKFRADMKLAPTADLFAALEARTKGTDTLKGYRICNDGSQEIWSAIALWSGKDFVSQGWWDVPAGRCATAIDASLGHDAIYLYASHAGNNHFVTGQKSFCVSNQIFEIHGRERCETHGNSALGFAATNTKGAPGYAAHINDTGLVPDQPLTSK
ncbi:MAG TPA: DUF1036 domain-containing protein [Rhizomicrobium sp.]|nr:DUF1036 domain-containing protein [Rhizomicrobium sp.]